MIRIRTLTRASEYDEAVDLQKKVWGWADVELFPAPMFVVVNRIGGQSFGAYDEDRMAGFCVALPALKPNGMHYLHSHMLAVLQDYQNQGTGRRLKLVQREDALARGIPLIEWTFDPLEIKNAFFNMERLGAIVREFAENEYGISSSPLHGGLPTDRCFAEWWLESDHVKATLAGARAAAPVQARIEVPVEIAALREQDPRRAREIQKSVAAQFQECFRRGLAVTGFEKTAEKGTYLLGRWA